MSLPKFNVINFLTDSRYRIRAFGYLGLYNKCSDKYFLEKMYYSQMGKRLNLNSPKTFSEKIQWLKLYDRRPEYTMMVDKFAVKEYVSDKIGKEYVIPTLGVWDSFEQIDFETLPNQFVLKCTHDSGGVVICKNKLRFNFDGAKDIINKSLKNNYYIGNREWPYKNVKPRIIAEKYMEDKSNTDLKDYKFYCFDGTPKYCQVISDRFKDERMDFFDMDWKLQNFNRVDLDGSEFKHSEIEIKKPTNLDLMIEFSAILSKGIAFSRIDFYEVNDKLYFGEITFYPASGYSDFKPDEWNDYLGDLIVLPIEGEKKND